MDKKSYFYVAYCRDQTFYGGYTTDLERRLEQHNTGKGAKYTRAQFRRPVQMIYAESYTSKSEAMKAEYAFKKLSRNKKEQFLKGKGIVTPFGQYTYCTVYPGVHPEKS
nr:GIY-YIG nuclease family protein [Lacticigenium naphthae]